jgi:hypothetical protein
VVFDMHPLGSFVGQFYGLFCGDRSILGGDGRLLNGVVRFIQNKGLRKNSKGSKHHENERGDLDSLFCVCSSLRLVSNASIKAFFRTPIASAVASSFCCLLGPRFSSVFRASWLVSLVGIFAPTIPQSPFPKCHGSSAHYIEVQVAQHGVEPRPECAGPVVLAILAAAVWRPCRTKRQFPALTSESRRRELSSEATMANVSEFSIVTYLRKPGHWRAAVIPKVRRIGSVVGGERVRSVVTPDDFASEEEAQSAAEQLIKKL